MVLIDYSRIWNPKRKNDNKSLMKVIKNITKITKDTGHMKMPKNWSECFNWSSGHFSGCCILWAVFELVFKGVQLF